MNICRWLSGIAKLTICVLLQNASNDPATSKATAGQGNAVNPLEFSPASPDLSKTLEDNVCIRVLVEMQV